MTAIETDSQVVVPVVGQPDHPVELLEGLAQAGALPGGVFEQQGDAVGQVQPGEPVGHVLDAPLDAGTRVGPGVERVVVDPECAGGVEFGLDAVERLRPQVVLGCGEVDQVGPVDDPRADVRLLRCATERVCVAFDVARRPGAGRPDEDLPAVPPQIQLSVHRVGYAAADRDVCADPESGVAHHP
jgi:hypothetical protein